MLEHHIQKRIVYDLAFSDGMRFSELKPDDLDNKLFNYHLKQVKSAGLVEKGDDGLYRLTAEGRRSGISAFNRDKKDKARSVLFLIVRNADGDWLLYRRKTHPMIDKVGFMHASPIISESIYETANRELLEKTGLNTKFRHLGDGYFKVYQGEELESHTHFTLLAGEEAEGKLIQNDERAEYFWDKDPNFNAEEMLPNMTILAEKYALGESFFIEETFQLN